MRFASKSVALTLAALLASAVTALCLNPFGYRPSTHAECVKSAASARTEAAAKAQIAECRGLPLYTEEKCRAVEMSWARYVAAHNGVEWHSPDLPAKEDCRRHYRNMFSPRLWVTTEYCLASAARLAEVSRNLDPTTGRSLRIEAARRSEPELRDSDDRSAVVILQQPYYRDMLPEELAAFVFIDAPPDALAVEAECRSMMVGK